MRLADKEICSGCHACYNACPIGCISMICDEEGFLQPHINNDTCVNCGKCKYVCPVLKDYKGNTKGRAFACINKNEEVRMSSSSGGIFTLIAEYVLDMGGVVFGAAFDNNLDVRHIEVKSKAELSRLRGSKYLQSVIGNSFRIAKKFLDEGKYVLFTGTPCQISGFKSYLGKDYDNLILQDIVCHGVPSSMVWRKYLDYRKSKINEKMNGEKMPNFRNKISGWYKYCVSIYFENNKEYVEDHSFDIYMKAFLNDLCLRRSCYACHFKSLERESDITLADFWGVNNILPDMYDDRGTSLVLINSEKGMNILKKISCHMKYKEVDIDEAIKYNPSAVRSCSIPRKRGKFMNNIRTKNFEKTVNKYAKESVILKIKILVKVTLSKIKSNIVGLNNT